MQYIKVWKHARRGGLWGSEAATEEEARLVNELDVADNKRLQLSLQSSKVRYTLPLALFSLFFSYFSHTTHTFTPIFILYKCLDIYKSTLNKNLSLPLPTFSPSYSRVLIKKHKFSSKTDPAIEQV